MTSERKRGTAGFTMLEVLLALAIFATTVGGLLELVSENLHALADARHEAAARAVVEEQMRTIADEARQGVAPPVGTTDGIFDPPHEHLSWELTVEPFTFPLPELRGDARERARLSSTLFAEESRNPQDPQPSARLVVMRVFDEDGEEPFAPYALFAIEPQSNTPGVTEPTGRGVPESLREGS